MKVIKFGGTSVANPDSLSLVIDIINRSDDKQLVVVSALSGVTDLLSAMAKSASNSEINYKEFLNIIEQRHKVLIDHFIPVTKQSEIISFLKANSIYPCSRSNINLFWYISLCKYIFLYLIFL